MSEAVGDRQGGTETKGAGLFDDKVSGEANGAPLFSERNVEVLDEAEEDEEDEEEEEEEEVNDKEEEEEEEVGKEEEE